MGCSGKPAGNEPPTVSLPSPGADPIAADNAFSPDVAKASSFSEAITEDCPEDQQPPPDRTLNGLSTGKLREAVQRLWGGIAFTTPSGKKLAYSATLDTEYGPITMTLLPEVAPNHVRNFVALARAGYYDGLLFEHVIQQEGEGGPEAKLELIEGGCPLGTGEAGIGHLGYWLKPEFNAEIKHVEGTVGACLTGAPDTAACRFYITLSTAPVMDGNFTVFAKVTHGLDVVRTIAKQPRPDGSLRPNKPAVIRKVTIQTREVD
jgi:peptidyl-prolyl cis-trans isomerase B (cyclophilin B)